MFINKFFKQQSYNGYLKGFSLIESFIAISILLVGILASFTVVINSLGSVSLVFDRLTAAHLGQEAIEIVENIRENNFLSGCSWWNQGLTVGTYRTLDNYSFSGCGNYLDSVNPPDAPLYFNSASGQYGYLVGGSASKFKRRIEITQISNNEIKVNVIVSWTGRGGIDFSVNIEKHLFNYY